VDLTYFLLLLLHRVNNAALLTGGFALTPDGIESHFAIAVVGHVLLTDLLLPVLKASAPSRVVNVSSSGYAQARVIPNTLAEINKPYGFANPVFLYTRAKLGNIYHVRALSKELEEQGTPNVQLVAIHPGFVGRRPGKDRWGKNRLFNSIGGPILNVFAKSPIDGAMNSLWAATSPELEGIQDTGHKYFVPVGKEEKLNKIASDDAAAGRMLTLVRNIIKEKLGEN